MHYLLLFSIYYYIAVYSQK